MAVEKLAHSEFAKNQIASGSSTNYFPSFLDIFYHPFFEIFLKTRVFQRHSFYHQLSQNVIAGVHRGQFAVPMRALTDGEETRARVERMP